MTTIAGNHISVIKAGIIAGKLLSGNAIKMTTDTTIENVIMNVYEDMKEQAQAIGSSFNQEVYVKKELMKRIGETDLYELQTVRNPENGELYAYFFVREEGFRKPFVMEEGTNRVGQIDPQLFQYLSYMLRFNRLKPVQDEMWYEDSLLKVKVEQK